jgi:hypothetical protein
MLKKYTDNKLYCFSPPVMLLTFIIEFGLAIYTAWRYKITPTSRLAIAIFLSLGVFQLSEYMICGGLGLKNIDWARYGFASITLLPALGIHMLTVLAEKNKKWLINAAYATCTPLVAYFLISPDAFNNHACYANYAVFNASHAISLLFSAYYYGWMIVGIFLAKRWGDKNKEKRATLYTMIAAYLAFIVPTTYFNIIDPTTVSGIPSIMCGFAVLLAIILSWKILPANAEVYEKSEKMVRE